MGSKACKTPLKFTMFATIWSQGKEKRFLLHHCLDYAAIMTKIFLFFISLRRWLSKYLLASTYYIHDVTNLSRRSPPKKNMHNLETCFLRNFSGVLLDLLPMFFDKSKIQRAYILFKWLWIVYYFYFDKEFSIDYNLKSRFSFLSMFRICNSKWNFIIFNLLVTRKWKSKSLLIKITRSKTLYFSASS